MHRTIAILGSTGSIGENAIWVARVLADDIDVYGVAAGSRWQRLADQAGEFGCREAVIADAAHLDDLNSALPRQCRARSGVEGMVDMVTAPDVDMVLCAITGTAGLRPVLAAIQAGKDIALASKEVLVMAGELVMREVAARGVRILPVDSEHSAIFQCLEGQRRHQLRRLILTASGGPFRESPADALQHVTYQHALAHPTWNMGPKITIDSATLMNKALEVIEARWLFDVQPDQIDVLIHPQSVVHSMIELADSSILAQLGTPDMRLPIQAALLYPERRDTGLPRCDFTTISKLEFGTPDNDRFPALLLAHRALATGGTMPAVLNAANEVAVERFAAGQIAFPDIWCIVECVMQRHTPAAQDSLDSILDADAWARREARAVQPDSRPS